MQKSCRQRRMAEAMTEMRQWSVFLPKEHGAYGQITFPLVAAFGVAGFSAGGLLIAIAVIAAFLGHEPMAIVLGQRGVRARRELRKRAMVWLGACVVAGAAAGAAAVATISPGGRWSIAVPAVPGMVLIVATIMRREKSWYGESSAALAFAGAAVPVTIAGGASLAAAWTVAIPFALLFTTTTLAVRVVILRVRGGGDQRATAATRRTTLALCTVGAAALTALTAVDLLSPWVLVSSVPGLLTATLVAVRPPAPAHLRRLGWRLVAVSTLTTAIVVMTAS